MSLTDADREALMEKAARAFCHPHHHAIAAGRFVCYACEPRIRAVVTAVADDIRGEALREAADALEACGPMTLAQYVATLRLYAAEPWRLRDTTTALRERADRVGGDA